jgi:hypothetical protein
MNIHPHKPSEIIFSKQTSIPDSPREVNANRVSPATSLGRPYSFPSASRIYTQSKRNVLLRDKYVDVDSLTIAFIAADDGGDDNKRVRTNKIADTPWSNLTLVLSI